MHNHHEQFDSRTRRDSESGFTLIEAVVAATMFVTVAGTIMSIYLYTLRINRRADVIRSATENARFISEFLSKEIRNGFVVYQSGASGCNGLPNYSKPDYRVQVMNVDGDTECFYLGDNAGNPNSAGTDLWLVKNGLAPVKVNSNNISFDYLAFYIDPPYNPRCKNPPACTRTTNEQPKVTLIAKVRLVSGAQDASVVVPIETTVTIPQYDLGP